MSEDDTSLRRDREILKHIQHRYDEEERRFHSIEFNLILYTHILRNEIKFMFGMKYFY